MPSTRQDLQSARRQRILESALELFARQGFDRTSTRQIARMAGLAEGTIFNYFRTKKDILMAAMAQTVDEYFVQDLPTLGRADALEVLRENFRSRLALGLAQPERIRFILSEILLRPEMRHAYFEAVALRLITHLEPLFQQRITEGYVRPCNVRIVASAVVGAILAFLLVAALDEDRHLLPYSVEEISDELARLFLYGLQPAPAMPAQAEV
mgnify:CR=1 FL=1